MGRFLRSFFQSSIVWYFEHQSSKTSCVRNISAIPFRLPYSFFLPMWYGSRENATIASRMWMSASSRVFRFEIIS